MLKFIKPIFLGAGDWSVDQVKKLHKRLDEAVNILCGLQQPGHPESKQQFLEEQEDLKKFTLELQDAILDIFIALNFNNITLDCLKARLESHPPIDRGNGVIETWCERCQSYWQCGCTNE